MKKLYVFFAFLLVLNTNAQDEKTPVIFKTSLEKISETEYDLILTAKILDQWHLYSQYNPDNASLPMEITIASDSDGFELLGKAKESTTFKEYSDVWEKEEIFFKDKAIITQRIKLTNKDLTVVKIDFFAQVCKTVCIQIEEVFTFSLDGKTIIDQAT